LGNLNIIRKKTKKNYEKLIIKSFLYYRLLWRLQKALIIWGTNLTSSVGYGRYTKQVSNIIILAPYQYSVIVGLLLSDGWIIFGSKTSKNARLGFKQSLDKSAYILFVFNILSHYYASYPH
jgi:hypothetical protein